MRAEGTSVLHSAAATTPAASAAPPAISIRGLTKTFGKPRDGNGEQALKSVDLDVRSGEFLVLLGPSGCGKTTLLRSIAGLERPEGGTIEIEGQLVFDAARHVDVDPKRRQVTMIFQSYALWPHMTAARNVAFPLRCAHVPRREIAGRVSDIMTKVGIGHLGSRYPGEMSGGQQQRLALARALVVGQRVVLFDEPLSNVDAQVREKLRLELIRMQRTLGFTAIYVTHDQSEAMELADRIAVMSLGRLAQIGSPRELYVNPYDIDVARFLGQSNEIAVVVEEYDATRNLVTGSAPVGRLTAVARPGPGGEPPRPGERLVVFGRPGDFAVAAAGAVASGHGNTWPGRIEATRFLGTHAEHVVQCGEARLRCWVPADAGVALREGAAVNVSVEPARLQAIREE